MARRPARESASAQRGEAERSSSASGPGGRAARAGWLGAYAVLTFLSFPHPVGDGVLDLGWLLAWAGPPCLILGISGLPPRRAAWAGLAAGVAAHWAVLHWIYVVTVRYGHAHPVIGVLAPGGLAVYIGAFTALFAALWATLSRAAQRGAAAGTGTPQGGAAAAQRGAAPGTRTPQGGAAAAQRGAAERSLSNWLVSPLVAAALWTAVDHLRSFALTGFPWATLGYAQHENPALLGLAAFTGVYGLSFVTVLGGVTLLQLGRALRAGRRPSPPLLVALGVLVAAHAAGALARATAPADPPETVRVAVLQGNIDQGVKWSTDWVERTLSIYAELTQRAAAAGAEVVVWPETALPGALGRDPRLEGWVRQLARAHSVDLVVGAVGLEAPRDGPLRVYDSAFLVDGGGTLRDRYDKSHLVPFGEYVPFQDLVGSILKAVARGIAATGVSAGAAPRPVVIESPATGPLTAGVPICYELLFPDLVRRFVRDGAEILFAITNDAWYGRTGAPYQFLAITALRSAENRVWTARAANTGVSAIIDAGGRVRARTRIFERDLLVADLPLRPAPAGGSFYARHGDVFAGACWLGVAAALAGARITSRRRGARA